ncbi:universal stress protein [Streptomyces sp. NPDC059785]|uniref:universal stress protein n=1 Tax=Streptomyces sp. NPDC059785 TaxID=3346945 RepID=UPI0036464D6D
MLPFVVVGVDGSAESLAAVGWAAREAARRERVLRLLHVRNWHPRQTEGEGEGAAGRHLAWRVLRQAEQHVHDVRPDVRLDIEQVAGPATAALLKQAGQAELLALGSRGLGGLTSYLVGSVAAGVVARATRPVVLVRADQERHDGPPPVDDAGTRTPAGPRDVVLGMDIGEACDAVVEFAFEAARVRDARLNIVHAWRAPRLSPGPGEIGLLDAAQCAEEWRGFLSALLRPWREKYPGVRVLETVVEDRPSRAVVRAAAGAALLVVGHRLPERPAGPRTGRVTHAAIHHAGCPVAVVPHA